MSEVGECAHCGRTVLVEKREGGWRPRYHDHPPNCHAVCPGYSDEPDKVREEQYRFSEIVDALRQGFPFTGPRGVIHAVQTVISKDKLVSDTPKGRRYSLWNAIELAVYSELRNAGLEVAFAREYIRRDYFQTAIGRAIAGKPGQVYFYDNTTTVTVRLGQVLSRLRSGGVGER